MKIICSDDKWLSEFLPSSENYQHFDLGPDSTGDVAGRRYYCACWDLPWPEIQSLSQRFQHVVIYLCEPLPDLRRVCRTMPANAMIFADVVMDHPPSNYRYIGNWFMTTDNIYQRYNWAKTLLSRLDTATPRTFDFDCLLGVERQNKNAVYEFFLNSPFRNKIFLTYHRGNIAHSVWHERFRLVQLNEASEDPSLLSWALWTDMPCEDPQNPESTLAVPTQNLIPVEIFNTCNYSIVAEGFFDTAGTRLTEKTAKALLGRRVMVYFGGNRDLARLRDLGFQTWHGIIDESYDMIKDDQLRWHTAWQQVESLCQRDAREVLDQARSILDHNQQWFLDVDWFSALRQYLSDVINSRPD